MKKLLYIPLVLSLLLQWCFVVAQNVAEVFANGFEEIVIVLRNSLTKDAPTKPTGDQPAT